MVSTKPRVSIGLPIYNAERYLAEAIDSILAQTYTDFELIISDNASTDRTQEIALEFAAADTRIRYVRHDSNRGAAFNFNYVVHHTDGEFFHWAAHDDVLAPTFLEKCLAGFEASPGAVLVFPQTALIDEQGSYLRSYTEVTRKGGRNAAERLWQLLGSRNGSDSWLNMCFPVFGLIRRAALRRTSLIANFPRSDMLLLVELALLGSFVELPDELFFRRVHGEGSVIRAERVARNGEEIERLLAEWFDPRRGKRHPATHLRLGMGYLKAAMRTHLPISMRLRVLAIIGLTLFRQRRTLLGEVRLVGKDLMPPSPFRER